MIWMFINHAIQAANHCTQISAPFPAHARPPSSFVW